LQATPKLQRDDEVLTMARKTLLWAPTLAALAVTACVTSPTGRRQLSLVPEQTAIGASAEAYTAQLAQLRSEGKLVTESRVTRRVDAITERLVAQAIAMRPETADWKWSVAVIDDPEMINAWCMAGGRMAVYTGLLDKLDPTDDELAQVLAHEISHALANHTAERMSVAIATQAGVALAGAVADDRPEAAQSAAAIAAQLAIQLPQCRDGSRRDRHRARRQGRLRPERRRDVVAENGGGGRVRSPAIHEHPSEPGESAGKACGTRAADDGLLQRGSPRPGDAPRCQRRRGPLTGRPSVASRCRAAAAASGPRWGVALPS
jgi:hypothetical protein